MFPHGSLPDPLASDLLNDCVSDAPDADGAGRSRCWTTLSGAEPGLLVDASTSSSPAETDLRGRFVTWRLLVDVPAEWEESCLKLSVAEKAPMFSTSDVLRCRFRVRESLGNAMEWPGFFRSFLTLGVGGMDGDASGMLISIVI